LRERYRCIRQGYLEIAIVLKAMVLVSCPSLIPRWISLLISFEPYLRLAFAGIPVLYPHNSKLPFPAHDRPCVQPESISYINTFYDFSGRVASIFR